jgi:hypothetical protein
MKKSLFAVASAITVLASGSVSAQTSMNGPYYANPSWDQQLPAAQRFIVLSNWIDDAHPSGGAAVLDRETGLIWEQSPNVPVPEPWGGASFVCYNKNVGGRGGWRLPSIQEFRSLVDPKAVLPALPAGHPFTNVQLDYWSATTEADSNTDALFINFSLGGASHDAKSVAFNVWCVRGGTGSDAQ